jgi:hypothetical protein
MERSSERHVDPVIEAYKRDAKAGQGTVDTIREEMERGG